MGGGCACATPPPPPNPQPHPAVRAGCSMLPHIHLIPNTRPHQVCPDGLAAGELPDALKAQRDAAAAAADQQAAALAAQQQQELPSSWADLPEPLLEMIFNHLKDSAAADQKPKALFLASSACRTWRGAAQGAFYASAWQRADVISHPRQLYTLVRCAVVVGRSVREIVLLLLRAPSPLLSKSH